MKLKFTLLAFLFLLLFVAYSYAEDISLSWNPNFESNLAGYIIYAGKTPGNYSIQLDVGMTSNSLLPSHKFSNVPPGTYCFVVTAYNSSNQESTFSNEVCKTILIQSPIILPPTGLRID